MAGWSGAGLYDSKTQHPDEGHISKSVKQVFASLWNFRAFEEREFYRIDHFTAAMGLLVHTNFSNEIANGVAVTFDPFYQSESTYYLNAQVGEDLVTNPSDLSIPEEVLVSTERDGDSVIMRPSNRVPSGGRVISLAHIAELKSLLSEIDRRFRSLYRSDYTGMEIEFKITEDDEVAIKQARPWVR